MAEIASTPPLSTTGMFKISWEGLATGDTGSPLTANSSFPAVASVQIGGTFNAGTTVSIQGSNDGSNWFVLKDLLGADIAETASALIEFSASCMSIRPIVESGSADSIDIFMVFRK